MSGKRYSNELLNMDFPKLKAGEFDDVLTRLGITSNEKLNFDKRMELVKEYVNTNKPEILEDWIEVRNQIDQYLPRFERYSSSDYMNPEQMIQKTLQMVVESYIYTTDAENKKELLPSLKEVKDNLKVEFDNKIKELLEYVKNYNNKIDDLEVEPIINFARGFQTGKLYLTDSTGTYHIMNKGEGTRKRLFMSILDWDRKIVLESDNKPVIRAYDEPDANLHYEAQRKMFYTIRDITNDEDSKIQAMICTHSLTMIDRAPAKNINLLSVDGDGKSCVVYLKANNDDDINKFLCEMSASLGISNSSIFYERCFIFVEGPTEESALPILYNRLYSSSVVEDGIKIVNIEGCGSWASYVKLMGINKRDLLLFFLDSDCNNPDSTCNLNDLTLKNLGFEDEFIRNNVVYIGDKEFEDSFKSNIYVKTLNACWPKQSNIDWEEADINSLRSSAKFSKSLEELVWRESRLKGELKCTKPKLGMETARRCALLEDIPVQIKQLFDKARAISGV